jgi:Holliday junction resolvase RusA-like endonuclease
VVRLELPGLPPSANNAYGNRRGGGRFRTEALISFQTTSKLELARRFPREMMTIKPHKPYLIAVRFFFEAIENAGWATGKAANRYKRLDADNRIKFVIDVLAEAGGVDDSQFTDFVVQKRQGTPERTVLWVRSLEEEKATSGDELFRALQ